MRHYARQAGSVLRTDQLPIFAIAKQPNVALRLQLQTGRVRRSDLCWGQYHSREARLDAYSSDCRVRCIINKSSKHSAIEASSSRKHVPQPVLRMPLQLSVQWQRMIIETFHCKPLLRRTTNNPRRVLSILQACALAAWASIHNKRQLGTGRHEWWLHDRLDPSRLRIMVLLEAQ